jgi:hypothetical protein
MPGQADDLGVVLDGDPALFILDGQALDVRDRESEVRAAADAHSSERETDADFRLGRPERLQPVKRTSPPGQTTPKLRKCVIDRLPRHSSNPCCLAAATTFLTALTG